MRLGDPATGDALVLGAAGYQFPTPSGQWHDDNWLVITGEVTYEGRSWSFRDPCLLTTEAQQLGAWLRSPGDALETFIEPLLEFWMEADVLRVSLGHEAIEAGGDPGERVTLRVPMSREQLSAAAATWADDLREFPERPAA